MSIISSQLKKMLIDAFQPHSLEIEDQTAHHEGHRETSGGLETHFKLRIVSPFFEGKTRLQRHKAVYCVLNPLLKGSIHALSLHTLTPEEHKHAMVISLVGIGEI